MRGVGLIILMVAAFIAVILFLKSNNLNTSNDSNPKTQYERIENVEKTVDEFNKATEERMKDLDNIK